jgi:hypothetical protein
MGSLSGLGQILGPLAGAAGKITVSAWLTKIATEENVTNHVGQYMYSKECGGGWDILDEKERNIWRTRASHAIYAVGEGIGGQFRNIVGMMRGG